MFVVELLGEIDVWCSKKRAKKKKLQLILPIFFCLVGGGGREGGLSISEFDMNFQHRNLVCFDLIFCGRPLMFRLPSTLLKVLFIAALYCRKFSPSPIKRRR